jgi:hypothetical protein
MRFERLTYSIHPTFADPSVCEIETNPRGTTYAVSVYDGNGHREIQASAEAILPILDSVNRLSLPIPTAVFGLDGTVYSLRIGAGNSVTYSWWQRLPDEWGSLEAIVAAIEALSGIEKQQSWMGQR